MKIRTLSLALLSLLTAAGCEDRVEAKRRATEKAVAEAIRAAEVQGQRRLLLQRTELAFSSREAAERIYQLHESADRFTRERYRRELRVEQLKLDIANLDLAEHDAKAQDETGTRTAQIERDYQRRREVLLAELAGATR